MHKPESALKNEMHNIPWGCSGCMLLFGGYVILPFVVSKSPQVRVSSRPYFTGITFTIISTTNTTQILQVRKTNGI